MVFVSAEKHAAPPHTARRAPGGSRQKGRNAGGARKARRKYARDDQRHGQPASGQPRMAAGEAAARLQRAPGIGVHDAPGRICQLRPGVHAALLQKAVRLRLGHAVHVH